MERTPIYQVFVEEPEEDFQFKPENGHFYGGPNNQILIFAQDHPNARLHANSTVLGIPLLHSLTKAEMIFCDQSEANHPPGDSCLDLGNWARGTALRVQVTAVRKYADITYRLPWGDVQNIENISETIASEHVPATKFRTLYDSILPRLGDTHQDGLKVTMLAFLMASFRVRRTFFVWRFFFLPWFMQTKTDELHLIDDNHVTATC